MDKQNEIDILYPHGEVVVAGEYIEVMEYPWGKTMKAARPLSKVLKASVNQVKYLNDLLFNLNHNNHEVFTYQLVLVLGDIMDEAGDDLIRLVRLSVNKSTAWIKSLPLSDFLTLLTEVYRINQSFFHKIFEKQDPENKQDSAGVKRVLLTLSEYGYTAEKLLNKYTVGQIAMLFEATTQRDMYKQAVQAEATMLAIGGCFGSGQKQVSKVLNELKGSAKV